MKQTGAFKIIFQNKSQSKPSLASWQMFSLRPELVIKPASPLYALTVVDFGEWRQMNELPLKSPLRMRSEPAVPGLVWRRAP